MNQRIRELAEQCYHRYSEHNINLEKFAELIVRECIDILETPGAMKVDEPTLNDFSEYNQGWVNGRKLGISHIKEHFEIKE